MSLLILKVYLYVVGTICFFTGRSLFDKAHQCLFVFYVFQRAELNNKHNKQSAQAVWVFYEFKAAGRSGKETSKLNGFYSFRATYSPIQKICASVLMYLWKFKVCILKSVVEIPGCVLVLPFYQKCIPGDMCRQQNIQEYVLHHQIEVIAEGEVVKK